MKRLLMIAYDFPPLLPGVRRAVAFARYLRDFDWQAEVVTVKPVRSWAYDSQPLKALKEAEVKIHRAGSRDPQRIAWLLGQLRASKKGAKPSAPKGAAPGGRNAGVMAWLRRNWLCPDDRVGWVSPAARMALDLIRREKPDAVWTTSYPHSAHLVGLQIKRQFPDLPWIADFRDGWTQNADFFANLSPRIQKKSAMLEKQVILSADSVAAVSEPITRHFHDLIEQNFGAEEAARRALTIPNGFDAAEMSAAKPIPQDGFSLTYTGTLFGARSAQTIFAVAAEAIARNKQMARDLQLVFVGSFGADLLADAEKFGLANRVKLTGPLPYTESLGVQKGSSALAALAPPEANVEIMTTQKIFEYLAVGRPVLLLAPDGSCKDLVQKVGGGMAFDPRDPVAAAQGLIQMRRFVETGNWRRAEPSALAPYERKALTGRLAALLDSLLIDREGSVFKG